MKNCLSCTYRDAEKSEVLHGVEVRIESLTGFIVKRVYH